MLDTVSYSQSNGVWTKTVASYSTPTDINNELVSLQAQLNDLEQSQLVQYSSDVSSTIINYQQQIAILQGV